MEGLDSLEEEVLRFFVEAGELISLSVDNSWTTRVVSCLVNGRVTSFLILFSLPFNCLPLLPSSSSMFSLSIACCPCLSCSLQQSLLHGPSGNSCKVYNLEICLVTLSPCFGYFNKSCSASMTFYLWMGNTSPFSIFCAFAMDNAMVFTLGKIGNPSLFLS